MVRVAREWQTTFDATNDAVWILDKDQRVVRSNKTAEQYFRRTMDQMIGKHCWEIVHATEEPIPGCPCLRLKKSLHREKMELQIGEGWFEITVDPILDQAGQFNGAVHIVRDITDHKQAEKSFQREKIFSDSILNSLPAVFYLFDEKGRFLRWNKNFENVSGYSGEEVANMHPLDFFEGAERDLIRQRVMRVFVEGEADAEADFISKNGKRTPYYFTGNRIQLNGTTCLIGMGVDITDRKRAEDKIKESEETYRNLFQNAQVGLFRTRISDGKILESNEQLAKMFGYDSREEFVAEYKTSGNYVDAGTREKMLDEIKNKGFVRNFEVRFYRKDRSIFWAKYSAKIFEDKGWIEGVSEDVTERKEAEATLRELKELHENIIQNMNGGVIRTDIDGTVTFINPNLADLLGRKSEELVGRSWYDFVPAGQLAVARAADARRAAGQSDRYEIDLQHKNGTWLSVLVAGTPHFDPRTGAVTGTLAVLTDITKRKRAENALRESDQKFRELFDSISDLIYAQDLEGRYLTVNRAFRTILGYDTDEFIGRTGADFMKPESRPLFFSQYLEDVKKQGHLEGIAAFYRKDGTKFYVEYRSKLVRPEHGPPYISGIGRDVTERILSEKERERLKAQLIQAQKMESVGRLAGGVAHDFNNMLGVILGRVEMMLMEMQPDDPHYVELEEIQKAALRSADLTRQLLAFARRQAISLKVLNLNDTVEGMLKMLRRLIGEDIDLIWRPDANLWAVKMDSAQVDQVLANLCVNARDAISGTGNVTIETQNVVIDESYCAMHAGSIPGEYVMLAVSDDGCGMDNKILGNLFEPFFTTKIVGKGTGLGLATVYGIVKQNNGFIDVYSEVGKGTIFKIYIPRHEGSAVTESDIGSLENSHGSRRDGSFS